MIHFCFKGKTNVSVKLQEKNKYTNKVISQDVESLSVTVTRLKRIIDTVFSASVATLVSIMYINFGCALEWGELKSSMKKPIGPAIGFIGQFIFMPIVS